MPFYLKRFFRSETFVDEQLSYRVRETSPYLLVLKVTVDETDHETRSRLKGTKAVVLN